MAMIKSSVVIIVVGILTAEDTRQVQQAWGAT